MVARSVLAALGTAAVAAAFQSLAAAAAPASAIFQQSLRGKGYSFTRAAENIETLTALTSDDAKSCTAEIKELRGKLGFEAAPYNEIEDPTDDVAKFVGFNLTCASVASGKFSRLHGDLFLFSIPNAVDGTAEDDKATCKSLVEESKKGFATFKNQLPPKYNDASESEQDPYSDPNAVAFLSMLLEDTQNIYCGVPGTCAETFQEAEKKPLLCFMKGADLAGADPPVSVETWRKVMQAMEVEMPTLKIDSEKLYMNAMNELRQDSALGLKPFTDMTEETYDDTFNLITCDDIKNDNVFQQSSADYTFIYAAKEGNAAPTPEEAIEFWKGGFKDLEGLPAFASGYAEEAAVYKKSAVAGFASLMAEEPRKVRCQTASCSAGKSAVVCALAGATLLDKTKPIEDATWQKLQAYMKAKQLSLTPIAEDSELLKAINAYRTSEALGLSELKASAAPEESEEPQQSDLLKAVTCEALESSSVAQVAAESSSSLLYIVGSDAENLPSGAEALAQLKLGFAKFEKTLPAEYTAESELYKDAAAVNFISLVSDKVQTADCYAATGCSKQAIICQLSPPALAENKAPLEQATWDKVVAAAAADPAAGSSTSGSSSSALSAFAAALAFAAAVPFF